jgi:hypothetical protein
MKQNLINLGIIAGCLFYLTSCGSNSPGSAKETSEEKELKGFMVGGMYFMQGFGGVETVESTVSQNGTDKKSLVQAYREIFILPFKTEQAAGIKSTLKESWDIDSKEKLVASIEELKTKNDPKNPHKAWDFARIVNNACMGYGAGYLTAEETKKYAAETLELTQKQFKTWGDFLKDFNAGRIAWDPKAIDMEDFNKVTADMTKNSNGIYQLLPLIQ